MKTKAHRQTHFEQVPVSVAQAAATPTRFPAGCPRCARFGGVPFRARTELGFEGMHVDVRCHFCQHEWQIDTTQFVRATGES